MELSERRQPRSEVDLHRLVGGRASAVSRLDVVDAVAMLSETMK